MTQALELHNTLQIKHLLAMYRAKSGKTQIEVAKELGYSTPQFVSNWERGLSVPPIETWAKLSKLLDIPRDLIVNSVSSHLESKASETLKKLQKSLYC